MLKRIFKQKRYFKNIYKAQKGITGLETAIILIAFVVVAAVFAYTVLSAGLFSTQKSQEAVYNGLAETQNTLEVKGGVLSQVDPKFKDACDAAVAGVYNANAHGAMALETTIVEEGTGSLKVNGNGSTAANDIMVVSKTATMAGLATGDTITFWAKISNTALSNNVGLAVNAAAASCNSNSATTYLTIVATDTNWHQYSIDVNVADNGTDCYYGIYALGAIGAVNSVYIDDIEINNVSSWTSTSAWTPASSKIILTLALAAGGQSIDFTAGTDGNGDGLFSGSTNKIVVDYNDAYTHLADVAWTGTFIGNNNNDQMLDQGEKIKLIISLKAVNAANGGAHPVSANHQFTLEVKSPKGAILSLQRTMPARLYSIDNLN